MTKPVKAIPDDFPGATPYLSINGAASAIEFYKQAFGATEIMRLAMPDGRIGHADLRIGAATIMLADEFPEMGFRGPQSLGGTPVAIHLYVEDVDALVKQAVAAGAKLESPAKDEFYGDRAARLNDPYGHRWMFARRQEDLSPEEMRRRAAVLFGGAEEKEHK
jgi:PhnB protein